MHDINYLKFTEGNSSTNRRHVSLARPYMEIISANFAASYRTGCIDRSCFMMKVPTILIIICFGKEICNRNVCIIATFSSLTLERAINYRTSIIGRLCNQD